MRRISSTNWPLVLLLVIVMVGSTTDLVLRFNVRDPMSYFAHGIAVAMWLGLAAWIAGPSGSALVEKRRRGSDMLTGALVALALAALCVFLVASHGAIGVGGSVVVVLFVMAFSRAFYDFLKACTGDRKR